MVIQMPSCGGCRTCEMACSFRHKGEFSPSISSIQILERENEPGFLVCLMEKADGERIACDGCKDLETPECVSYCVKDEDLKKILMEHITSLKKYLG